MTRTVNLGNSIKPLRNVAAMAELVRRVEGRAFGLPGMATFYGRTGLGKSYACAHAAAHMDCIHVSVQKLWTAKTLLQAILTELSIVPKSTNAAMMQQLNEGLARAGRTLVIDEADYAIDKGMIEIIRDMHDGSSIPVILVGMELLPQKLRKWELVDGRMLSWVGAEPCDLRDAKQLAALYAAQISLDDAMIEHIVAASNGSARKISTNLAFVQDDAILNGMEVVTRADWGGKSLLDAEAPGPRALTVMNGGRK